MLSFTVTTRPRGGPGLCSGRSPADLHPSRLPEVRPAPADQAHLRHYRRGHQGHPQGVRQGLQHHPQRLLQRQVERPPAAGQQGLLQGGTLAWGKFYLGYIHSEKLEIKWIKMISLMSHQTLHSSWNKRIIMLWQTFFLKAFEIKCLP